MSRRLLISYLSLTLFVLLVLEVPLGITFARRQFDELTTRVERDATVIATFALDELNGPRSGVLSTVVREYARDTGARVVVVDSEGLSVIDTDPPAPGQRLFATRPEFATALSGQVATGTRPSETLDTDLLFVAVPVAFGGSVLGAVRITYPTSEVDRLAVRGWLVLGGVAAVCLAVAAGLGVALARSVSRPLRQVEAAATALGYGRFGVRAQADAGPPEVRSLAMALNGTAARLEELVAAQESFVADASHQLRSPLTALQLRLENLEADVLVDGRDDLDGARLEVERLSRLVDGLLTLARADKAAGTVPAETIELSPLLEERRGAWAALAEERDVDLVVSGYGRLRVRATSDRLVQVVDNLVANAIDVSPASATVTLSTHRPLAPGWAEIHVVDQGPGLSAEQRQRAFDRFWRGPASTDLDFGRQLGGSGLGLAIVEKLVKADGGEVRLDEAVGGGIEAVVKLKLADP